MQMLRLYRDPQGKSVFMPPQGTSVGDDADVETLRTRVRELEKMLTDQTTIVSIIIVTFSLNSRMREEK